MVGAYLTFTYQCLENSKCLINALMYEVLSLTLDIIKCLIHVVAAVVVNMLMQEMIAHLFLATAKERKVKWKKYKREVSEESKDTKYKQLNKQNQMRLRRKLNKARGIWQTFLPAK